MKAKIVDGTWVTMVTPFTEDNKIDYAALESLVEWFVEKKADGLFAVCQSSEMFYLTPTERVELAKFVVKQSAGRLPVVVSGHVADNHKEQLRELAAMAEVGADAVVLVTNRLAKENESDAVLQKNLEKIMKAVPNTDLGLYECPYPYKRILSPDTLKWCADSGRFGIFKDTCCDIAQIDAKLRAIRGTRLKLFNANGPTLLESMRRGASGYCGVMMHYHPQVYNYIVHNWQTQPEVCERLQSFASLESMIETRLYPVNGKYNLQLYGLPVSLQSRVYDKNDFDETMKLEVRHLHECWDWFKDSALREPV